MPATSAGEARREAVLFNGPGHEITAEIVDSSGDEIQLRKLPRGRDPAAALSNHSRATIPKGKKHGLIVQKAVEIGAAEIAPSFPMHDRTGRSGKRRTEQAKWQQIAIEAPSNAGRMAAARHAPRRLGEFLRPLATVRSARGRLASARCATFEKNPR